MFETLSVGETDSSIIEAWTSRLLETYRQLVFSIGVYWRVGGYLLELMDTQYLQSPSLTSKNTIPSKIICTKRPGLHRTVEDPPSNSGTDEPGLKTNQADVKSSHCVFETEDSNVGLLVIY